MNNDTLLCIFDYIQLTDLLNCYLVCKHYHHVANNDIKWKSLFCNKFMEVNNIPITNYRIQYKRHYKLNKFLINMGYENINKCIIKDILIVTASNLESIPAHAFSVTRYARRIYMRFLCGNLKRMHMRRA